MMLEQDNLRLAPAVFDAWNAHDPDGFVKPLAEDYVSESDTLPELLRGRDGARRSMRMYIRAFPDLQHTADLMGIPASGRRGAGVRGCTVMECKAGQVVRDWVYWDVATLLRQIGAMPAPAGGTA